MKSAGGPGGDRGQLGFDFLVGMSVFLITIAFVIGFVPGMFDPFVAATGGNTIVADRGAAHLSGSALVDSSTTPGVLNTTCTVSFFNTTESSPPIPSDCRFETRELHRALGVNDAVTVNVTIQEEVTIRTIDGIDLRAGPTPSDLDDVTVAQRVVVIDGESSKLYVRVW